jgi:23S rRNA (adenine2503-C2)-methyltransferase
MTRILPDIAGIKAFDIAGLEQLIEEIGQPKFRTKQLVEWIYGKGVSSYDDMTNLPKTMREQLAADYPLHVAEIEKMLKSQDGTRKYLIRYSDGTLVEAVGIPTKTRLTVCISTQAGCPMQCVFCATGKGGFSRNLAPGEIFDQVSLIADDFERRVTNVVAMGQGEPFLNYEASIGAARFCNSPSGANIGARHITISTSGIVPMIRKFSSEPEQFTLAVSLHSAVQNTRDKIMPGLKGYDLTRLRSSIDSYGQSTGRRPTIEYAMMDGVNDSDDELDALVDFCKGMLCHVNLIPLNKIDSKWFRPSRPERVELFAETLNSKGIETSVRNSRGSDIQGACGQLMQIYKGAE